jgi:hypothetical protein
LTTTAAAAATGVVGVVVVGSPADITRIFAMGDIRGRRLGVFVFVGLRCFVVGW